MTASAVSDACWEDHAQRNQKMLNSQIQGKTPWVAPACADCPGFLVLGSAPDPVSTLVSEPQIVPLA